MVEILFELLMKKESLDKRDTDSHPRKNGKNLKTYITMVKYNIDTLNQNVNLKVEGSNEGGGSTDNLMTNLFNTYNVAYDT